jgi:hypothetical protein
VFLRSLVATGRFEEKQLGSCHRHECPGNHKSIFNQTRFEIEKFGKVKQHRTKQ